MFVFEWERCLLKRSPLHEVANVANLVAIILVLR